jgi:porin
MPGIRFSSKVHAIRRPAVASLGLGLAVLCGGPMLGAVPAQAADAGGDADAGLFSDSRSTLLGDMGGLRSGLAEKGVTLNLSESSEVLGNVAGGTKRGFEYDGVTTMGIEVDTSKALGWEGGTFNASALQLHGHNLSADNLGNLQTASGIAADNATRLWELWFQQNLFGGVADIKLGQQSIDNEFMASEGSALYLNTMMGWPMIPSADLYAGGPAFPLSSLGARVRAKASDTVTVLGGVFNDNPPGGSFDDDSALRGAEKSGLRFNLNTGALIIGEIQYAVNPPPEEGKDGAQAAPTGLPGTYKLGFWYDTAKFPDQRFDTAGLSLANAASTGVAASHSGNYSVYAVADQAIWRPDPQGPQTVSVFARPMFAPSDRNLITFSVNAGINLKAPLPGRDDDTFGIGYGYTQVSDRAADLDSDTNAAGTPTLRRDHEQFIEVTYQAQLAPWWQVQPDFQYVFNPGGGVLDPASTTQRIKDEAILGVRTNITF